MTKKCSAEIGTLLFVFGHSLSLLRVSTFALRHSPSTDFRNADTRRQMFFSPSSKSSTSRNGVDTVYRISDRLLTADYYAIPPVEIAPDILRNLLPLISPPG